MGKTAMSAIGDVYMGLLDANKNLVGGLRKAAVVYPLSIQVATEQKKLISRGRGTAGQTVDTKSSITDTTGAMILRQWDAAVIAWALSGKEVEMTEAAGTVSAESITVIVGEFVKLPHKDVSAVVAGAHVLGTDYEVNEQLGLFMAIEGGAIPAGALSVDYSYAKETGYKVNIGSKALIRVAMMIDGENEFTNEPFYAEFDSVVISSSGEINIISDPGTEYEELPFTLSFETLPGKTSPGTINKISM